MNDETFPSWEDLADLSSGGQAAELRAVLFDSSHPEHGDQWRDLIEQVTYGGDVFSDAPLSVPFLIQAVMHGDQKTKTLAMGWLAWFAWDADFSKSWEGKVERHPLREYEPELMLAPMREHFEQLRPMVNQATATDYYTLGVLTGKMAIDDLQFLREFPEIEFEYMAANLKCSGYAIESSINVLQNIFTKELKDLVSLVMVSPYKTDYANIEDFAIIYHRFEHLEANNHDYAVFSEHFKNELYEMVQKLILEFYDCYEIVEKLSYEDEGPLGAAWSDAKWLSIHKTLRKIPQRGIEVSFNNAGIVMDVYQSIESAIGAGEIRIPITKLCLDLESWEYLFQIHRIQDNEGTMDSLGIYNTPEEIDAKLRAANLL